MKCDVITDSHDQQSVRLFGHHDNYIECSSHENLDQNYGLLQNFNYL